MATQNSISPGNNYGLRTDWAARKSAWPEPSSRCNASEQVQISDLFGICAGGETVSGVASFSGRSIPQRRPTNRDEFDGPAQFLTKADDTGFEPTEEDLPHLPVTLFAHEQDEILSSVNDRLSVCAYNFVARYQFPIPVEPDKRTVHVPSDREWSEWVFLLKRLATKRRIPARVLYNGQIKQFITVLESSLETRHIAEHQIRPLKDDRNVLQLISSALQVAKMLKDAPAMRDLDVLYTRAEDVIHSRRVPTLRPFLSFS